MVHHHGPLSSGRMTISSSLVSSFTAFIFSGRMLLGGSLARLMTPTTPILALVAWSSVTPDWEVAVSTLATMWALGMNRGVGAKFRSLDRTCICDVVSCLEERFTTSCSSGFCFSLFSTTRRQTSSFLSPWLCLIFLSASSPYDPRWWQSAVG